MKTGPFVKNLFYAVIYKHSKLLLCNSLKNKDNAVRGKLCFLCYIELNIKIEY